MKRFAIAFVLVACSGSSKQPTTTSAGSGAALYAKKVAVGWGISAQGSTNDVFLQLTDETGKQVSYPLGSYAGTCKVITPVVDMKALTAVGCDAGASGTELDAVVQDVEIVILKTPTTPGAAPDPMAREEVTRVKAPGGAKIEAGT